MVLSVQSRRDKQLSSNKLETVTVRMLLWLLTDVIAIKVRRRSICPARCWTSSWQSCMTSRGLYPRFGVHLDSVIRRKKACCIDCDIWLEVIPFSRKQCRLDVEMTTARGGAADLWRTCVRSLIHDIPATSMTSGKLAILSARWRVTRARPFVLIDLHRHPSSAGSGRPTRRRLGVLRCPERVMSAADSRACLCGGPAGGQCELASCVTGSVQPTTNKTNGVDWITGALPRQMTPRSWFMAFHVDLPTVPVSPSTARWPSSVVAAPALIRTLLVSRDRRSQRCGVPTGTPAKTSTTRRRCLLS